MTGVPYYPAMSTGSALLTGAKVPRILVVDDQPANIQILYELFHESCEVFAATGGEQALGFCHGNGLPDLILLDVMMPGLDGFEVCRLLKESPETTDVPVIFVTAQHDPAAETAALETGGVDFITKPINPAVVRARVNTHLTLKRQSDLLRSLAYFDSLTGVANRRRLDEALDNEWRGCRRRGSSLALLMIDIDYFKRYNDRYGHQAGDVCLHAIADTLRTRFGRPHDLVARYGGEEFVCLMPECDLAAGRAKANELLDAVASRAIPHADSPVASNVTISIGIAAMVPTGTDNAADLLAAADAALYQAKKAGRDRACTAS